MVKEANEPILLIPHDWRSLSIAFLYTFIIIQHQKNNHLLMSYALEAVLQE